MNAIDTSAIEFDIEKKPLFTEDGIKANRFGIIRKDTREMLGVVSETYNVVEHRPAFQQAVTALDSVGNFQMKKLMVTNNGARMYAHFEHQEGIEIANKGDIVRPTLILTNSLDCSSKYGFLIGAFRLVCSNGLMAGVSFLNISVKHTANIDIEEIANQGRHCLEVFSNEVVPTWNRMGNVRVDLNSAVEAMMLRKNIPQKITQRVLEIGQEKQQKDLTVWELFNHYTYHLTHEYEGAAARKMQLSVAVSRGITEHFVGRP